MFHRMLAEVTVTAPVVDASTLADTVKTMLSSVFTVDNLFIIIVTALGMTASFFIFWFAYRFIKRKAERGLKRGSL